MIDEAMRRLREACRDEGQHSEGKYGPHVDGVLVSDLRLVLREADRSLEARKRDECMKLGHEFVNELSAELDGNMMTCIHCGAERDAQ